MKLHPIVSVRNLRTAWPLAAVLAAALWVLSPVASAPDRLIPIRHNTIRTVPVFNAWTVWWNADQLAHGYPNYWNAPVFWPHAQTFAWSEPQPLTAAVAPVVWLTGSPTAGYNAWLLLSLLGNGLMTLLVLRRLRVSRPVAAVAAVLMVWLPINIRHMEVIQLIPVWPLLWTWDALRRLGSSRTDAKKRFSDRRGWLNSIELALAYSAAFFCSVHHTLFLSILLLVTVWPLVRRRLGEPAFLMQAVGSLGLAAVLVGMMALPMHDALDQEQFARRRRLVTQLSVQPPDLLLPPKDAHLFPTRRKQSGRSPGWVKLLLAAVGLAVGWRRSRLRPWTLFLGLTALTAGLLAMGPHLKFDGIVPWWWLTDWVPGLKLVRSVFRFTYFLQIAVVLLAAIGLQQLMVFTRCRWSRAAALGVAGLVGVAALVELPVPRPLVAGMPKLSRHEQWTGYLKQHVPPGSGIACLPFASSPQARDFDVTVRWMYYGTLHGVPMVNGYSGFFPDDYLELRRQITDQGLTPEILAELTRRRVSHLVLRRDFEFDRVLLEPSLSPRMQLVWRDPTARIDIYQVQTGEGTVDVGRTAKQRDETLRTTQGEPVRSERRWRSNRRIRAVGRG